MAISKKIYGKFQAIQSAPFDISSKPKKFKNTFFFLIVQKKKENKQIICDWRKM